jgi:hypothetical protein
MVPIGFISAARSYLDGVDVECSDVPYESLILTVC